MCLKSVRAEALLSVCGKQSACQALYLECVSRGSYTVSTHCLHQRGYPAMGQNYSREKRVCLILPPHLDLRPGSCILLPIDNDFFFFLNERVGKELSLYKEPILFRVILSSDQPQQPLA